MIEIIPSNLNLFKTVRFQKICLLDNLVDMETFIYYYLKWKLNVLFEISSYMKKKNQKPAKNNIRKPTRLENETQIVHLLLKCGQFLQRETNQVCQRFGLKQQQFSVLNEIVQNGPISQKELVEILLFEKSNISKIVNILFKKNWIRVVVSPLDRRLTLLSDTPEGLSVWKDCMKDFQKSSVEFSSVLKEDAVKVARLLKKLENEFRTIKNLK